MMTCDRPTSITLAGEARLALVSVPLLVTALGTPNLPTTGSSFVSVTVLGLVKRKYYLLSATKNITTDLCPPVSPYSYLTQEDLVFILRAARQEPENRAQSQAGRGGSAGHGPG